MIRGRMARCENFPSSFQVLFLLLLKCVICTTFEVLTVYIPSRIHLPRGQLFIFVFTLPMDLYRLSGLLDYGQFCRYFVCF